TMAVIAFISQPPGQQGGGRRPPEALSIYWAVPGPGASVRPARSTARASGRRASGRDRTAHRNGRKASLVEHLLRDGAVEFGLHGEPRVAGHAELAHVDPADLVFRGHAHRCDCLICPEEDHRDAEGPGEADDSLHPLRSELSGIAVEQPRHVAVD